ncbi:hypothetical protein BDP27DRAFT_1452647 [Rhodocollybia butyracea]|uniref:Hydrophobin n=1 Tax=Rhodocollybia butyracea TaxID=206335 RepID=A0A9P5PED9_9AGAR|nr:hypothetical protein BDP27DRAFT_1452647 [Rhodocollybia butyracea]
MQIKLALVTAAVATLAVANPTSLASSICSTGSLQCCEKTETAAKVLKDHAIVALLKRAGINTKDITGLVGFGCSDINVAGGGSCAGEAVCCTKGNIQNVITSSPSAALMLPSDELQQAVRIHESYRLINNLNM